MLESRIPTASEYNGTKLFEEQVRTIDPRLLGAFEEIFIRHQMHSHFGVDLLRRHQM